MKQKLFFGIFVLVFCLFGAACQSEAAAVEMELPVLAVVRAPVTVPPVEAVPLAVVVEEAMAKTAVTTVERETAVSAAQEPVSKLGEAEVQVTEQENIVASAGQASIVMHEVTEGEWIYELARCYGSTPKAIIMANHLRHPNWIYPGQMLAIPEVGEHGTNDGPPCVEWYVVKAGDTWDSIAAAQGTTADIVMKANPGPLYEGRRLVVPAN